MQILLDHASPGQDCGLSMFYKEDTRALPNAADHQSHLDARLDRQLVPRCTSAASLCAHSEPGSKVFLSGSTGPPVATRRVVCQSEGVFVPVLLLLPRWAPTDGDLRPTPTVLWTITPTPWARCPNGCSRARLITTGRTMTVWGARGRGRGRGGRGRVGKEGKGEEGVVCAMIERR